MHILTRFSVIALSLAAPLALLAQNSAPSQADLIQALLARIDKLEKRVAELETKNGLVAEPKPVAEAPVVHGVATHDHEAPVAGPYTSPSLRLAGFSDFNFAATDQRGAKSGFNEGQFILHLSSALSSRVAYFGELSFTARTDAGMGSPPAPGFNVEVERSIIRFDQSDKLKMSFGRYHTPINYWNTALSSRLLAADHRSAPGDDPVRRQLHSCAFHRSAGGRRAAGRRLESELQRRESATDAAR